MIPSRPSTSSSNGVDRSISTRLALLRREDRSRRLVRSVNNSANVTRVLAALPDDEQEGEGAQRNVVGLTKSWGEQAGTTGKVRERYVLSAAGTPGSAVVKRRMEILGLVEDRSISSLKSICLRIICCDLVTPTSIYLDYLNTHRLPHHIRAELLSTAAIFCPLNSAAVTSLLLSEEGDEGQSDGGRDVWDDETGSSLSISPSPSSPTHFLTKLDLSFSSISLSSLRSILTPDDDNQRRLPASAFPHLHTLILSGTPNIAVDHSLFRLLSSLFCLESLGLAAKSDLRLSDITGRGNNRAISLSLATPSLRFLDISFSSTFVSSFRHVDFKTQWLRLAKLRAVECMTAPAPLGTAANDTISPPSHEGVKKAIWEMIKSRSHSPRPWIDIETK